VETVRIAVISDTHMPRGSRALPARAVAELREADAILHGGDFMRVEVLEMLQRLGPPVHGVHGNVDDEALRRMLPAARVVELGGVRIGMIHDAGPRQGRLARMRFRFKDADAVVFGHSHLPLHEADADGFQIFNPGSPTERRSAPTHTMGIASVEDGRVHFELIAL
jgi:putative phosphoesterase